MKRSLSSIVVLLTAIVASAAPRTDVADAAVMRLTNQSDATCQVAAPMPNADATLVAFESNCDLTGSNTDRNREIFQVDRAGVITQLTDTSGCVNANPSSSAAGTALAFDSDCDLGANADGNVEIVRFQSGLILQLTDTANCANLAPSMNAAGNLVSFDSDCDITGANLDGNVEVFRSNAVGVIEQLTDDRSVSGCASLNAASDATGQIVAFESDCDLVGGNSEQVGEIFQHRQGSGLIQMTQSFDEPCVNVTPAMTSDGSTVAFSSDCDALGTNPDGSTEIYSTSATDGLYQLTSDPGLGDCESIEPSVVARPAGDRVVFSGYCNPTGENGDGSFEIFRAAAGVVNQLTSAPASCWSASPRAAPGDDVFVFVSNCDLDGTGGGGATQIYLDTVCSCGSPVSDGAPTATDALFALQAAVGAKVCGPCDCDVSGDGLVSASDALRILNKAIGLEIEFDCP